MIQKKSKTIKWYKSFQIIENQYKATEIITFCDSIRQMVEKIQNENQNNSNIGVQKQNIEKKVMYAIGLQREEKNERG